MPETPELSPDGRNLVYRFETGGRSGYNPCPEWPGYSSGVTIGIGTDLGYYSKAVILEDWSKSEHRERLASVSGIKGPAAKPKAREMRDILISWDLATEVFERTTLSRFWTLTQRTYPGFEDLRLNAQSALVSLVFNRGSSFVGPSRVEMRDIRPLVPKKDYSGIARKIRAMKRLWPANPNSDGDLTDRREAEARLVETP